MKKLILVLLTIVMIGMFSGFAMAGEKEEINLKIQLNKEQMLRMSAQYKLLQIELMGFQQELKKLETKEKAAKTKDKKKSVKKVKKADTDNR